jgi:hypothetical protein
MRIVIPHQCQHAIKLIYFIDMGVMGRWVLPVKVFLMRITTQNYQFVKVLIVNLFFFCYCNYFQR